MALPWSDCRTVLDLLRQRGLEVCQHSQRDFLFLPRPDTAAAAEEFYGLMKHYSFRLVVRDVIRFQDCLTVSRLIRFVEPATAELYLAALVRLGVLEQLDDRYRILGGPVENIGATLEWFVARVLFEEFAIPALHGMRIRSTAAGGDYDVVGAMSGQLVYVETKSAPPKHIEDREVEVFLLRLRDLKPDLAVFLVDTNLRMMDKVVQMFARALGRPGCSGHRPQRLDREIFHVGHRLFITNSKHELVTNLRDCLRAYHASHCFLSKLIARRRRGRDSPQES
ncbi:MAG: hypothetical protein HY815_31125 [Candidatus Riflebacteria bacterium]|nr:hypothetical protein [Candidatus Riflebacteria bacterium]